ncbi:hypothetical protein [Flavihumibacter solisilvae]|uniref:Uncharacterized protein n=1 Tax=Flavihumibacter solisilvae TaxID=1349421 RepID=A0A0C1LAV2_9BACT|nr:hypothetical protein [Flavihumibacter solisilvae]KIC92653.1 hypothetical protein OI18_21585 [Flavihumibacter solisilvae]
MSSNKKYRGDEGYVGQELLGSDPADVIRERCSIIQELVNDNTLTLDRALKAYQVTAEQYFQYLALNDFHSLPEAVKQYIDALEQPDQQIISMQVFESVLMILFRQMNSSETVSSFLSKIEHLIHRELKLKAS